MTAKALLLITTTVSIAAFYLPFQFALGKKQKGKKRAIIALSIIFASLGIIPLYHEPDRFGLITPFSIYYHSAIMPESGMPLQKILDFSGMLFATQFLHLGIALGVSAFLTRKSANLSNSKT